MGEESASKGNDLDTTLCHTQKSVLFSIARPTWPTCLNSLFDDIGACHAEYRAHPKDIRSEISLPIWPWRSPRMVTNLTIGHKPFKEMCSKLGEVDTLSLWWI